MLPGFRFLFAAIVLSMSVLVFGLGAAALLRAAHEEVASTPLWRAVPEPRFAQQNEPPEEPPEESVTPVLAMLRVEPEPAPLQAADGIPAATAAAEPPAIPSVPDQPEQIAALEPEIAASPEAAKPEIPAPEPSVQSEAPAAGTPAPNPAEETRIATAEQVLPPAVPPPANEAAAPAFEQAIAPSAAGAEITATKIATLGGPPVAIEAQPTAKATAMPDQSVAKERLKARRAAQRRRIALLRARQAAQQQAADPFALTTRSR